MVGETGAHGALPAGVEERRQRVGGAMGGYEQRALVAGPEDAPPLLLLHGIAGSADEWAPVMPALATKFRVHAPDAPGHGFSEKPANLAYDLATYRDAAVASLDELSAAASGKRVHLMALSGGGTVALSVALDHGDRIDRLVLVDAAGIGREVSWDYRLASLSGASRLFRRSLTPAAIRGYGRRLLYHADRLPPGWVERRRRIWATEGAIEAFFRTARATLSLRGQRHTFGQWLHEIKQPTLVVWGREDPIIPVAHAYRAAQQIPNARLEVFERCGHVPPWEYPQEFSRAVLEFLEVC